MAERRSIPKTVAIGLSGGVDSSVAASLLQQQGYDVVGLTMRTWDGSIQLEGEGGRGCFGPGQEEHIAAARRAAENLGIPHVVIPLAGEFRAEVLEYFRREYLAGRTPNPCVRCNRRMKFDLLLERARASGVHFDAFATGHYAGVRFDPQRGRYLLLGGRDPIKDQSYFLSGLSQEQLSRLILPLGEMCKEEVRRIALDRGWRHLVDRPESQDFIACDRYDVLFQPEEYRPGPIINAQGEVVGEHGGIIRYTVGQRRGLGIGGSPQPLYVTAVDGRDNSIHVGGKECLYSNTLVARDINWIASADLPAEPLSVMAKIRQAHRPARARVVVERGAGPVEVQVTFDEPQLAITPGQTVAFYEGEVLLGAGTIS